MRLLIVSHLICIYTVCIGICVGLQSKKSYGIKAPDMRYSDKYISNVSTKTCYGYSLEVPSEVCWTQVYPAFANSVDPDQLASAEANWSGSALFVIKYVNLYQQSGSSNLIGWK